MPVIWEEGVENVQAERTDITKVSPAEVKKKAATEIAHENVEKKAANGIGITLHTGGRAIKGLAAMPVVAKPQRKMLRRIEKIKGHPDKGNCIRRFHLYREGMTLLHCKITEGLIPSDVTFYAAWDT